MEYDVYFKSPVVKITFDQILTTTGSFLVRLGDGVLENSLIKKTKSGLLKESKAYRGQHKNCIAENNFCQLG